jgi:hypothetical protein
MLDILHSSSHLFQLHSNYNRLLSKPNFPPTKLLNMSDLGRKGLGDQVKEKGMDCHFYYPFHLMLTPISYPRLAEVYPRQGQRERHWTR